MAKMLYTVETGGDSEKLNALADALHDEFPAFYVSAMSEADACAALVIRATIEVPDSAWERLDGWGFAGLVIELVK